MKVRAKGKDKSRFAGFFDNKARRVGEEFEIPEKKQVLDDDGRPTGKFVDVPRYNEENDTKALKKYPQLKGKPRAFSPRWMEEVVDPRLALKKKMDDDEAAAKQLEVKAKQTKADGDVQAAAAAREVADASRAAFQATQGK